MENNVKNIMEAFEQEMKNLSEPQQTEEKTVKKILTDFAKGLSPIDFFMLKNAPEKGIKFIGEEYESVKGEKVTKNDYITYSAFAVSTLAEQKGKFIRVIDGDLFLFTGTHYEPIEADVLRKWLLLCTDAIGAPYSTMHYYPNTNSYVGGFRDNCLQITNLDEEASKRAINVANGIISFDEKGNAILTPHTHKLPYVYSLKYEYNPDATAPTFLQFLDDVLPDEQARKLIQAYIGSIFTDLPPQKVVFMFGDGANGKSVFTRVIKALLDQSNVTEYKISELCDNAKGENFRINTKGKLLNISEEAGREFDSDTFKNMVSGGAISGKRLYHDPITFTDYARLLFSCNALPQTKDRSNGFYRRIVIIKFPRTFSEEEQDPELESKIVENELSGVLNWVIKGVQLYIKNGYKLPRCKESEKLMEEYKVDSDSVLVYLKDKGITAGEKPVLFSSLFQDFNTFVTENNYKRLTSKTFSQRLKKAGIKSYKGGGNISYVDINTTLL
jgi:putative DNA primase/helicase